MSRSARLMDVYLEIGEKRVFAVSLDWPGWARVARGEDAALQSLIDYGPRYGRAIRSAGLGFEAPKDVSAFKVVERVEGNMTTDFGAPDRALERDKEPVSDAEMERWHKLLKACWKTVDAAAKAAEGKELTKGPRGGGRDLDGIMEHIQGGDASYLTALGGKAKLPKGIAMADALALTREAILTTMVESARGEIAPVGPRGGIRWSPRYFVRRLMWHDLDHVWEIEDRVVSG